MRVILGSDAPRALPVGTAWWGEGMRYAVAGMDVDATLQHLRTQLGSGACPPWPQPSFGGPVSPVSTWTGQLSDAAHNHSAVLNRQRQAIAGVHSAIGPLVAEAGQNSVTARARLDTVVAQWRADKAVLAPIADTSAGKVALLRAGALRVLEASGVVADAHARFTVLASRVGQIAADLPHPGDGVQAVDYKLAPPPDPAYPVNDVIAEATDLDGNHVILRRGYYDAASDKGFGWDKIYWKHGLINPNVFRDLVSHSRPKSNQGGTLIYEVPINKTHCTSGFLGLPSCTDTGETLTMRIVANTNPVSTDVPGGGQKGVITMFPLPGGSGVVEVKKDWTLTPPWVNGYAPIN